MEQDECKKCGKIIEGYSKKDVEWKMGMHDLKHRREDKQKEGKEK